MENVVKIRKKPIEVLAFKVTLEHCRGEAIIPFEGISRKEGFVYLEITTLEGVLRAKVDDWVIKGVNGEVYPIKQDILFKTYDIV